MRSHITNMLNLFKSLCILCVPFNISLVKASLRFEQFRKQGLCNGNIIMTRISRSENYCKTVCIDLCDCIGINVQPPLSNELYPVHCEFFNDIYGYSLPATNNGFCLSEYLRLDDGNKILKKKDSDKHTCLWQWNDLLRFYKVISLPLNFDHSFLSVCVFFLISLPDEIPLNISTNVI